MLRLLLAALATAWGFSAFAQSAPLKYDSAASTNSTLVVSGSVQLRVLGLFNTTAAIYWLKLYDLAVAPTCGTSVVKWKVPIPFGAANAGGGAVMPISDGLAFANGLGFCLTGLQADNDTTVAATGLALNFGIKQ
jgi:hypothetical protein